MKLVFLELLIILFSSVSVYCLNFLEDYVELLDYVSASAIYHDDTQRYEVKMGVYDETAPAFAKYALDMENSGWDRLALSSYQGNDNKYTDEIKSYAMGYLEGVITWKRIWNHFQNCKHYFFYNKTKDYSMPENIKSFLTQNRDWVKEMSKEKKDGDPFWYQANLIYIQFEALMEGYNSVVSEEMKIPFIESFIMNSHDIDELNYFKNPQSRPKFDQMSWKEIDSHLDEHNSCSALIKIAPDFSDVWFGHNTWTSYGSMTRIFKEYRFKGNDEITPHVVAMSSYPAAINSIDDFYITDKDLYVTETTNSILKPELYDLLTPRSLLTWHRTMIANRLSDNGKTWTDLFARYNSGTYNNQMQILDLKKIDTSKRTVDAGALWIIEQMPGYTESEDVTRYLRSGYWPSYNTAYFESIREKAGYNEALAKNPELKDSLDYHSCARANIFRRDQAKVDSLEALKRLLRYNNYQSDPLSKQNPAFAIASRKDLDKEKPDCRGATDAKVASIKDIKGKANKVITVISGPTSQSQDPFNTFYAKCSDASKGKFIFQGFPGIFNYKWIEYESTLFNH